MITSIALSRQERPTWWQWFNILSLDAPCVAMLWQYFFATAYRLHLPAAIYILLGISVWWLYVFDRCADVNKHPELAGLTHRHAFYHKHRSTFTYFLLPITGIGAFWGALYHLPLETLVKALGLAFCVGIYFLAYVLKGRSWFSVLLCSLLAFSTVLVLTQLPLPMPAKWILGSLICTLLIISGLGLMPTQVAIPKEFVAAYLFSIGTLLNIGLYLKSDQVPWLTEPTVLFCLLCFINLMTISRADRGVDEASHQTHQVSSKHQWLLFGISISLLLIGCGLLAHPYKASQLPFLLAYLGTLLPLVGCYAAAKRLSAESMHLLADLSLLFGAGLGLLAAALS